VSPYDFPGLVSGFIGFQLLLWGLVLALLSGLRALLVRGQAGRGHLARGILAGSALIVAAGLLVLLLSELTGWQRMLDAAGAPLLAGLGVLGAAALAVRGARRRGPAPSAEGEAPVSGDAPPPAGDPGPGA
jgi:hypothetical protein